MDFHKPNLFCILDNLTLEQRNNKRLTTLKKLGLLEDKIIPIFEEATQIIAHNLDIPICILGVILQDELLIKSVKDLSQNGLINNYLQSRKIKKNDTFSNYVIDSKSNLIINNLYQDSFFYQSNLAQCYGITSYLGSPLIAGNGDCIGVLEIMDTKVHEFSLKDINFVNLTARWCLAEYERNRLLIQVKTNENLSKNSSDLIHSNKDNLKCIIDNLSSSLTKKLSNPLTLIIGMTSILKRGIYGKLTTKQEEYLDIIYHSGQDMNTIIEKILDLDSYNQMDTGDLTCFDLESLSQQIINSLEFITNKKEQKIVLSLTPGNYHWRLNKNKIKQIIYYLLLTIIEGSYSGGEIQFQISFQSDKIRFFLSVNHSCLEEGIYPENVAVYSRIISQFKTIKNNLQEMINKEILSLNKTDISSPHNHLSSLLFSCYLIDSNQGEIFFKGSPEYGYYFDIIFPLMEGNW